MINSQLTFKINHSNQPNYTFNAASSFFLCHLVIFGQIQKVWSPSWKTGNQIQMTGDQTWMIWRQIQLAVCQSIPEAANSRTFRRDRLHTR